MSKLSLTNHILVKSLLVSGLVTSCAFKEEEDKEKIQQENTKQVLEVLKSEDEKTELSANSVVFSVLPNEKVGYYDVTISWPAEVSKMRVQVETQNPIIVSRVSGYTFTAIAGSSYNIFLTAMDSLGRELHTYEKTIGAPLDLVVDENKKLTQDTVINVERLQITSSGKIVTDGKKLVIIAKEIHFDDKIDVSKWELLSTRKRYPHIVTYEDDILSFATKPIDAESIEIEAGTGFGDLVIHAHGYEGTNGADGKDANQNPDPSLDAPKPTYEVVPVIIPAGVDARMERSCQVKRNDPPARGSKGHKGGNAGDGVDGGDAPQTIVNIDNSENFKLTVVSRPGKGGQPGNPGKGGPGGKGTFGLAFDDNCKPHNTNQRSADGEPGDMGDAGKVGQDGNSQGVVTNLPASKVDYVPLKAGTQNF